MKAFEEIGSFPEVFRLNPKETLVYAAVEFESEEHRNKAMEAIMNDPEMKMPDKPVFEVKRMVYGGFSKLVDV